VKFPSGEMPTRLADTVNFGRGMEDGGVAQAFLDEVAFKTDLTKERYFLYDPAMAQVDEDNPSGYSIVGVDSESEDIPIRQFKFPEGLPVDGLPEDGGVVKIDDELIAYREIDTSGGYLLGCERGVLGTEPAYHAVPSRIIPMTGIFVTKLEGDLSGESGEIRVSETEDFPDAGYVRIGDEIIGYTKRTSTGFSMPSRLLDDEDDGSSLRMPDDESAEATSGLFRGRFGTPAMEHPHESIVFSMPFRYWDRYARFANDAEMSYFEVKKHIPGAVWKRVSWVEFLVPNVDIHLLVRFDGGPDWGSDKIVELGTDDIPREAPESHLYLIKNPAEKNMLNMRSDRIEIRVLFPYDAGAYDRLVDPMPDEWKDTPRLKALKIEYVAPMTVLHHEELR
jgi:hypothetical protein